MKRKILALLAVAAMLISLASCAEKAPDQVNEQINEGALFSEPTTISIMFPQSNELFREDWKVWQYMREATGADLDLRVNVADGGAKIAVAFASQQTMPDLAFFDYKGSVDDYALQGALIAIDDVADQMPNWKKFWDKIDPEEREKLFRVRKSADGRVYWPARYGSDNVRGLKSWLYRRDIFEKHGLSVPETYDELYEVAKKLKELYPESYPIGCENFFSHIAQTVGPQWKPNFEYWEYYDFETETWHYGAIEDTMLDMLKVFKRFYDEGLINPNFTGATAREFNELVTTDMTFIFPHFHARLAVYNTTMVGVNDDFDLTPMKPPIANSETGTPYMTNYRSDTAGLVLANTGDKKRISNAVKLLDWMYSDEAYELLSWGKEGETYNIVNGQKQFILDAGEDIGNKYGFQTYAAGQAFDPEAVMQKTIAATPREDMNVMMENIEKGYNPKKWMGFTSEEQQVRADKGTAIQTYVEERISMFLLGQTPLSEWDSFVQTVKDMGVDELLKVYESAYNRVK